MSIGPLNHTRKGEDFPNAPSAMSRLGNTYTGGVPASGDTKRSQRDFDYVFIENIQRQTTPSILPSGTCHWRELQDVMLRKCDIFNLHDSTTYDFQIQEHCVKTYLNSPLYRTDAAGLVQEVGTAEVKTVDNPAPGLG